MSVTFRSIAVIGCEITSRVETTRDVRSCSHPNGRWLFCPQCGKPKWQTLRVDLNEEWDARLARVGLKLATTGYGHGERAFAGLIVEARPGEAKALAVSNLTDAAGKARAGLEKLDLYDHALFGMWSVGYCS